MTRLAFASIGALLATAGCGPPRLKIAFEVPAPFREAVDSVVLEVIAPPASLPFGCDDLAYGGIDLETARLSAVRHVLTRGGGTFPVGEVDRTAHKLLWVHGLNRSGGRVVTGCREVDEIDRDMPLEIPGEPMVRARVTASLSAFLGGAPPRPVEVAVMDAMERPTSVNLRWIAVGAAGPFDGGEASTDAAGRAAVPVRLPPIAGPFVLEITPRWDALGPHRLEGLTLSRPIVVTLPGPARAYRAGRVGPLGQKGLAALLAPTSGGATVALLYRDASSGQIASCESPPLDAAARLGILDDPFAPRDGVVAVTPAAFVEIRGDCTPASAPLVAALPGARPVDAFTWPGCTDAEARASRLLVVFDAGPAGLYDRAGKYLGPALAGVAGLRSAGCVTDAGGAPYRAFAVREDQPGGVPNAVVLESLEGRRWGVPWLGPEAPIDFSRALRDGVRPMVGVQLVTSSFAASRVVPVPAGENLGLVTLAYDLLPRPPLVVRGGDVDGDGGLDAAALLGGEPGVPGRIQALWIALAREYRMRRIAGALALEPGTLREPELLLADVDGNGADDALVVERSAAGGGTQNARVEIYRLGVTGR